MKSLICLNLCFGALTEITLWNLKSRLTFLRMTSDVSSVKNTSWICICMTHCLTRGQTGQLYGSYCWLNTLIKDNLSANIRHSKNSVGNWLRLNSCLIWDIELVYFKMKCTLTDPRGVIAEVWILNHETMTVLLTVKPAAVCTASKLSGIWVMFSIYDTNVFE